MLLAVVAVLAIAASLFYAPQAAHADSQSSSGSIDLTDPTYVHSAHPCGSGTTATHYEVFKAHVVNDAATTFSGTITPAGFRANVMIYQGVFLPDNPGVNCWGSFTGAAAGSPVSFSFPLSAIPPEFGQTEQDFYIVVAGATPSDAGSFTVSATSSALPLTLTPVPHAPPADTTPPTITVPASPVVAEATGPLGASVGFDPAPSATDDVDGSLPVACKVGSNPVQSGAVFPLGITSVTCSATDAAGNTATESFTVNVQDTTWPVITVPADITAEATSSAGAAVSFTPLPSALDAVDGTRAVQCTRSPAEPVASGDTFAIGATEITCQSSDAHGNTAQAIFTVTVRDTTAPTLEVPDDIVVEAAGPTGTAVQFAPEPSATDLVGVTSLACIADGDEVVSGDLFPVGTTTVSCTAADAAGNQTTETFTVTVADTAAPDLTVPDDIVVEADGPDGSTVDFTVTATDAVSSGILPVCEIDGSPVQSGALFAIGTTTVTCSATDAAGNQTVKSFDVTVRDTTGPALALPAPIVEEATGPDGAVVTFTVSASDDVTGALTPVCTPASGSTFSITSPLTVHTVSCTATDGAGNETTGTFTVTVRDTTAPAVNVPDDSTHEATSADGAAVAYEATATDLVDGDVIPECLPASGSTFAIGDTEVSCTASDVAGNADAPSTFVVTVEDTTAPVLTMPDRVIEKIVDTTATGAAGSSADAAPTGAAPSGAPVEYTVTATDAVEGSVPVSCTPASGSEFAVGDSTVTCTAADSLGNTATGAFTVSVVVVKSNGGGTGGSGGTDGTGDTGGTKTGSGANGAKALSTTGASPSASVAAGSLVLLLGAGALLVAARRRRAAR